MNKLAFALPVVILVATSCLKQDNNAPIGQGHPTSCTQEAKMCPFGNYVSRTGKNCEFADCPTPPSSSATPASIMITPSPRPAPLRKGIIQGKVTLGPTCPVERVPPDPACAPKPYKTTIRIQLINSSAYATVSDDAAGSFSISLDPGNYTLQPIGGNSSLPMCSAMRVEVVGGQTRTISLSCDTGIR